jgi:hypothetical protein
MPGNYTDARNILAYNSGTIYTVFGIQQTQFNAVQIAKMTTGTIDGVRFEASNYTQGASNLPLTGSGDNWAWSDIRLTGTFGLNGQASPPPTYLTASASPASVLFDTGLLNTRYLRVVVNVGFGDIFRIAIHGKHS